MAGERRFGPLQLSAGYLRTHYIGHARGADLLGQDVLVITLRGKEGLWEYVTPFDLGLCKLIDEINAGIR